MKPNPFALCRTFSRCARESALAALRQGEAEMRLAVADIASAHVIVDRVIRPYVDSEYGATA